MSRRILVETKFTTENRYQRQLTSHHLELLYSEVLVLVAEEQEHPVSHVVVEDLLQGTRGTENVNDLDVGRYVFLVNRGVP